MRRRAMVASALETRLRRLAAAPLQFWPFHKGLRPDEAAVRWARLVLYLGAVHAYHVRRWGAMVLPGLAALGLAIVLGGTRTMRLDGAALRHDPNPAGNAPLGDMGGRSADAPQPAPNVSAEEFARRLQEPIRVDDYQIRPVLAPNQGHQVLRDPVGIPSVTDYTAQPRRDGWTFQGAPART